MENFSKNNDISENVKRILHLIQNKNYNKKALHTFYENINNEHDKDKITDNEFEILIQELEKRVRQTQPKLSKILFGPKDEPVRKLLEEFLSELKNNFDFSKNNVGSHVKTGGNMINGTRYIDVYISYKNDKKWHCSFAYLQDYIDTDPYLRTRKYQGGMSNKDSLSENRYEIENIDDAKLDFIKILETILINL
tara:strand:- start:240 stop:821 length:582 start_codon:yes stop_codon:yes gene_type:complete